MFSHLLEVWDACLLLNSFNPAFNLVKDEVETCRNLNMLIRSLRHLWSIHCSWNLGGRLDQCLVLRIMKSWNVSLSSRHCIAATSKLMWLSAFHCHSKRVFRRQPSLLLIVWNVCYIVIKPLLVLITDDLLLVEMYERRLTCFLWKKLGHGVFSLFLVWRVHVVYIPLNLVGMDRTCSHLNCSVSIAGQLCFRFNHDQAFSRSLGPNTENYWGHLFDREAVMDYARISGLQSFFFKCIFFWSLSWLHLCD